MIVAATGHRPEKLGGYGFEARAMLVDFAIKEIERLEPLAIITGMAQGWDQAIAMAAHVLRVPFFAYVPFLEQPSQWPASSRATYFSLLEKAADVRMCSPPGYSLAKMLARNRMMVDDCSKLLALWNHSDGGTKNCIDYAVMRGREDDVINAWGRWRRAGG